MDELKPYRGDYYLWQYLPSTPAAGIFAALFILGTFYVAWKVIRTRMYFCIVFVIGGLFEIIGYCARAAARKQTDVLLPYVIQSTLLLVAPALFAASVYMVLGRVIRGVQAEARSPIPVKWLTTIFVCGDVISFLVQASGAGIMATGDSLTLGENIILAGLVIQIVMFGLFAVVAAVFHMRIRWWPTGAFLDRRPMWTNTMVMLYVVSMCILVRSVFRVIEYAMGQDGYLLKHEWTLYVFDGVLMLGVVGMFAWRFPSRLTVVSAKDAEAGRQGEAERDSRTGLTVQLGQMQGS
ncbi:RTA1 like protein-domain-containing protein [Annulohypoxylon bovei var. microspora]|nr:RTA1 like protein-domain-containing protein [Annulohypoxylon bovei var. microspora]